MCTDCDNETNTWINYEIWDKLLFRMEARLEYVGGCRKWNDKSVINLSDFQKNVFKFTSFLN